MKIQPTGLPWIRGASDTSISAKNEKGGWYPIITCRPDGIGEHQAQANCEFVHRACVAHDELLQAASDAEQFIRGFEDDETQPNIKWLCGQLRAAIAKARKPA